LERPLPCPFPPRSAKAGVADVVKTVALVMHNMAAMQRTFVFRCVLRIICFSFLHDPLQLIGEEK
jgi:hypothetical protein